MSYTGTVVMRWGMNAESDMAGYRIYKGLASKVYQAFSSGPAFLDVGLAGNGGTTAAPGTLVPDIPNGVQTFLAVTAYDLTGNESTFSAEGTITKAVPLLTLLRQYA